MDEFWRSNHKRDKDTNEYELNNSRKIIVKATNNLSPHSRKKGWFRAQWRRAEKEWPIWNKTSLTLLILKDIGKAISEPESNGMLHLYLMKITIVFCIKFIFYFINIGRLWKFLFVVAIVSFKRYFLHTCVIGAKSFFIIFFVVRKHFLHYMLKKENNGWSLL